MPRFNRTRSGECHRRFQRFDDAFYGVCLSASCVMTWPPSETSRPKPAVVWQAPRRG